MAGSYGGYSFNFIRNYQTFPPSGGVILHSHSSGGESYLLTNTCYCLSF